MLRVVIVFGGLALTVYALVDCLQTAADRMRHLPKPAWVGVILVAPVVGPAAWLLTGRTRSMPPGRRSLGPRGPEDDPDFLRNL